MPSEKCRCSRPIPKSSAATGSTTASAIATTPPTREPRAIRLPSTQSSQNVASITGTSASSVMSCTSPNRARPSTIHR